MRRPLLLLVVLAGAAIARGHPEIELALTRLNAGIAAAPADASLYLERGELYARHADWTAAEANYLVAAELNPALPGLAGARGALALATGLPAEARSQLDAAVRQDSADATARVLRARAHVALRETAAARLDYDAAFRLVAAPAPELVLERAALLPAAEAIGSIDDAIARIGPAVALNLAALALEESLGRIDAALTRLERLAAQSERKETWLRRQGDLLRRAGRATEARHAYAAALAAVTALPDWLRTSPESVQLASELAQLSTPSSSSKP